MKGSELLTIGASTIVTLALALGLANWLYPSLLGTSDHVTLVQSSDEVPPYFELIIGQNDLSSPKFYRPDPLTHSRGRQFFPNFGLFGPSDALGFRNSSVPNIVDVVAIGDSQTYGNNVVAQNAWPYRLQDGLPSNSSVYNMSFGGWGAVQYFYMFAKALVFDPRVVVIAFYTGNDAVDSFLLAYGSETWSDFVPDPNLSLNDLPKLTSGSDPDQIWVANFSDGSEISFAPDYRAGAIESNAAIDAGFEIMRMVAERIAKKSSEENIVPIFIVIPTKETVYAKQIEAAELDAPESYRRLVESETKRIGDLESAIKNIDGAVYVDVLTPLRTALEQKEYIYPHDKDGHPTARGYSVIGETVAIEASKYLHTPEYSGLVKPTRQLDDATLTAYEFPFSVTDLPWLLYVQGKNYWLPEDINKLLDTPNLSAREVDYRDIANLRYRGRLNVTQIQTRLNARQIGHPTPATDPIEPNGVPSKPE